MASSVTHNTEQYVIMYVILRNSKPPYEKTDTNKPDGPDPKASSGQIAAAP